MEATQVFRQRYPQTNSLVPVNLVSFSASNHIVLDGCAIISGLCMPLDNHQYYVVHLSCNQQTKSPLWLCLVAIVHINYAVFICSVCLLCVFSVCVCCVDFAVCVNFQCARMLLCDCHACLLVCGLYTIAI